MENTIVNALLDKTQTVFFKGSPVEINYWISKAKELDEELTYQKRQAEAEERDGDLEELARDNYYDR